METGIESEQFEEILDVLVERGIIGHLPETNADEDAMASFAWVVLGLLRVQSSYRSKEDFQRERSTTYRVGKDSVAHSIWLMLPEVYRNAFGGILNFVTLLYHQRPPRALKRAREEGDEDGDEDETRLKYMALGMGERRRVFNEVKFLLRELPPELEAKVSEHMPIVALARYMQTSRTSLEVANRVAWIRLKQDIIAKLDYVDEGPDIQKLSEFMARFATEGMRFWRTRDLNDEELDFARTLDDTNRADPKVLKRLPTLLELMTMPVDPVDASPLQLYNECVQWVCENMQAQYKRAWEIFDIGRESCVWIEFATPTHGRLFDMRFQPTRFRAGDVPQVEGFREFRTLTVDATAELLFAPLRDFHRSHNRSYPRLVPKRFSYFDSDDEDETEHHFMSNVPDANEHADEMKAFRDTVLNLMFNLSIDLVMKVERQEIGVPVGIRYIAIDTNGRPYTPEQYAVRSAASVSGSVSTARREEIPMLQRFFDVRQ